MGKKFTRSHQIKFQTVLYICVAWAIVCIIFAVHNHFFLLGTQSGLEQYEFWTSLFTNLLIIPLAGFMAGGTIVYVMRERMRNFPLWQVIVIDTVIIVSLIVAISLPGALIYNWLYFNKPPWDPLMIIHSFDFLFGYGMVYTIIFWTLVAVATIIMLQVTDRYGPGVFLNTLKGKYYRPRQETRIFMFLDIRSSTALAEQMGHIKWFDFLNEFFNDITEPILDTRGEIYQYVGDEIIIHWDVKKGIDNNQCLHCFFLIQQKIHDLNAKYKKEFGAIPSFKASMHCGEVTIGEIGKIKKEIVFSGDVLNTTARIQELCNVYQVDLLVSQNVMDMLDSSEFHVKPVGYIELRGKQTPVSIFTVTLQPAKTVPAGGKTTPAVLINS